MDSGERSKSKISEEKMTRKLGKLRKIVLLDINKQRIEKFVARNYYGTLKLPDPPIPEPPSPGS